MHSATLEQRIDGERRLRDLLPEARKLATSMEVRGPMSGLAEAMKPYLYETNFQAVVIKAGEKGGWIADLLLKDVPVGVSNAFGTPVDRPHETYSEALNYAKNILAIALRLYQPEASGAPSFLLHDVRIELDTKALEATAKFAAIAPGVLEQAPGKLERELRHLGIHDACDVAHLEMLRAEKRDAFGRLLAAVHISAAAGILAWPLRTARPFDPARQAVENP